MAKDHNFMKNLIRDFIKNTNNIIKEMHISILSDEFDKIAELAHTLDGSSRSIGAYRLSKTADEIYKLSRKKQKKELSSYITEIKKINNFTEVALFNFLDVQKSEVL